MKLSAPRQRWLASLHISFLAVRSEMPLSKTKWSLRRQAERKFIELDQNKGRR